MRVQVTVGGALAVALGCSSSTPAPCGMRMAPASCEALPSVRAEADTFTNGTRLHVLRYWFEGNLDEVWAAVPRTRNAGEYVFGRELFDTELGIPCTRERPVERTRFSCRGWPRVA